jgi:hypothetical protein
LASVLLYELKNSNLTALYHSVDDGSAVLESRVRHIEVPLEPKSMGSPKKKYKVEDVQKKKIPPFDIPRIGSTVRVMGKVRPGFPDGRMIRIDELSRRFLDTHSIFKLTVLT